MIKAKQLSHGSTALLDHGEGANNIVVLDSDGKLPAVDASNLQGIASSGGGTFTRTIYQESISANFQISSSVDNGAFIAVSKGGSATPLDVYLPAASDVSAGFYLFIGNYETSTFAIYAKPKPSTSDKIQKSLTSLAVARGDSFLLVSDGSSNWIIIQQGSN